MRPGQYLEQRGGFDAIKPSGGTAAAFTAGGIFTGSHEHTMADGFVYSYETTGGVYTGNLAQRAYFEIWGAADFEVDDAFYIGCTLGKFSRVVFTVGQALVWTAAAGTFAYEYPKSAAWDTDGTAATSGTFTLTATPDFTATGEQTLEVRDPGSAWVPAVRNGIYAYWMRVRVSAVGGGVTTACRQGGTSNTVQGVKIYSDWPGTRQIFMYSADSTAGTNVGKLQSYGQTSSTVASWNSVSSALFSGNYPRTRFASYRDLLYLVNGKEQKRWDGNTLADIGFTPPDLSSNTGTAVVGTGTALGNGVWLYAMTYGYGPGGIWGESGSTMITGTNAAPVSVATVSAFNDAVRLEWDFGTTPGSDVDAIYIYRTQNLAASQASGQAAFPFYRIKTFYRSATGVLPSGTGGSGPHTDETLALPFPAVDLDISSRTPPSRCRFVTVHKNRLFLGGNNQYPGRVWWSNPFEAESFNQDEQFADFTRSTGGQLSGLMEFGDQVVAFTEDKMFGIANVDQDQPAVYEIASVGCIAPDSVKAAYGSLMWVARDGVYRWTGEGLPVNVSADLFALQRLTSENHGGARATIHNKLYDLYFITNANRETTSPRYRYDMETNTWGTVSLGTSSKIAPLGTVTAPLGHADAGVRHPLYGQSETSGTDYFAYIGEWTNQDAGSSFTCTAQVLVGPRNDKRITPQFVSANYNSGSPASWGTPTIDFGGNSGAIGLNPAAGTAEIDGADDYSRGKANATNRSVGSGDILMKFSATTAAATITTPARLLALHMSAEVKQGI